MNADATDTPSGDKAPGWPKAVTICDGETLSNRAMRGPMRTNQIATVEAIESQDASGARRINRLSLARVPNRSWDISTHEDRLVYIVTSPDEGSST